jgi:hypothetical protein
MWDSISKKSTAEKVRKVMIPAHFIIPPFTFNFDKTLLVHGSAIIISALYVN